MHDIVKDEPFTQKLHDFSKFFVKISTGLIFVGKSELPVDFYVKKYCPEELYSLPGGC